MNPLVEEARTEATEQETGNEQSGGYAAYLLRRLAAALEAAEQRAEEAEFDRDMERNAFVCRVLTDPEAVALLKKVGWVNGTSLRALAPELRALDEAGKKATKGEWVSMGHSSVIFVDSGKTPIAKVYEQPTWTRGNAHFMCLAANARAVVAKLLREIEGEG